MAIAMPLCAALGVICAFLLVKMAGIEREQCTGCDLFTAAWIAGLAALGSWLDSQKKRWWKERR